MRGWHHNSREHALAAHGISSRRTIVARGKTNQGVPDFLIMEYKDKLLDMLGRAEETGNEHYFLVIVDSDTGDIIPMSTKEGDLNTSLIHLPKDDGPLGFGIIHTHPAPDGYTTFSERDIDVLYNGISFIGIVYTGLGPEKWDRENQELYREVQPRLKVLSDSIIEDYENPEDVEKGLPSWHRMFPDTLEDRISEHLTERII